MAKIILGVTGSVAAIRTAQIVQELLDAGHDVRIVTTRHALYFFDPATLPVLVIRDEDEWPGEQYHRGDDVLHIELRRWADLLLIAPLNANTLAKLAMGLSDNTLTCLWRAWDPAKPVLVAPAMNTMMWHHPLTRKHLRALAENLADLVLSRDQEEMALIEEINQHAPGFRIVGPIRKELACGDVGVGAMAEVPTIMDAVSAMLSG